jgi:hypothetical protein
MKYLAYLCGFVFFATAISTFAATVDPDADYDRLDGHGPSGKKVNVIEWEGNLEIHVYPGGSLKGLALKLDEKNGKKVMVIGYRFNDTPKQQLIRRALVSIPFSQGFHAYRDTTVSEYDKIIISNNGLSTQVAEYKLEPEPTQLYPDGHPALAKKDEGEERVPASAAKPNQGSTDRHESQIEDGGIKPFNW